MRKRRIGVIAFSDGREKPYELLKPVSERFYRETVSRLEQLRNVRPVPAPKIVHTADDAYEAAHFMNENNVDGVILNYATWTFPAFTAIVARNLHAPVLLYSSLNPTYPGLVGMLASGGSLEQLGIPHQRVWGDINDPGVVAKLERFCASVGVIKDLEGQVCGMIGGRSMGMNTTTIDPVQWEKMFAVDVEHIDQLEIVRRAELVDAERVEAAFQWLEEKVGQIRYDGDRLTPEKLKQQIKHYYALKEIVSERRLDFVGVKCHPELSSNYVTQCLAQAFFNDPYDWDGPHEPVVFSCECDMDGAMTMQILKLLTGNPVLFMDFRHYDAENGVFVFCNCGSQATYYAAGSDSPDENLKKVHFYPSKVFMAGGGAHVQYVAAPGKVTLARLVRKSGNYHMYIIPGEFVEFPREKCKETTEEWPTAFVKIGVAPDSLIADYCSNHIHAVYGDWVEDLKAICSYYGIEVVELGS